MGLPRSTYYDAPVATADEAEIVARIEAICEEFEAYGYRRVGAALRHQGMQPKSPFAPPPPPIVPPSDGIGLQAAAGRKPVAMRAVPSHDQLADKVSKWDISVELIWLMDS